MTAWTTPLLEGEIVRLEPIAPEHENGLWEATRDARTCLSYTVAARYPATELEP